MMSASLRQPDRKVTPMSTSLPSSTRLKRKVLRSAHSVAEFSERSGYSRATIWRCMRDGTLRFVQLSKGGVRKIPISEYGRLGLDMPDE
jgi:hypothetical protein